MIIRPYIPADRGLCMEIFNSNSPLFFDPAELKGFEQWLDAHDEGRFANAGPEAKCFYIAEQNNEITDCGGFCILPGSIATMAWGMVANAHHKQGIGEKLLKYRMQQIEAFYPGYEIILDTTQHTYGFFEKQGFAITAIKKNYYGEGLDRYDMKLIC